MGRILEEAAFVVNRDTALLWSCVVFHSAARAIYSRWPIKGVKSPVVPFGIDELI